MTTFLSDDITIAYETAGEGEPILLIHGFASNGRVNWVETGWVDTLVKAGHRVITIDNRGHGRSEKLYDPADYGAPIMAGDARRLLDHLGLQRADVMGYSMGARIAAFLAIKHPDRVRRVILAGLADNLIKGVGGAEEIAQALEANSADQVTDRMPRTFRLFAEQTGSDLKALAACMRSSRQKIKAEEVATIEAPVLVVAGSKDDTAGPVAPLVEVLPNAQGLVIEDRDHMRTVGDKRYKEGVVSFLGSA